MSVKEFGVGFRDHEESSSRDIIGFVIEQPQLCKESLFIDRKVIMNADVIIEKSIKFSQIKIVKFFFKIIEAILFWYYSKTFKKRKKKINGKFFGYFQLFCVPKLSALCRRKRHQILYATLDPNSKIDNKVYELTNKSYVKLFDLDPS